jgi:hypothetical protein
MFAAMRGAWNVCILKVPSVFHMWLKGCMVWANKSLFSEVRLDDEKVGKERVIIAVGLVLGVL